MICVGSWLLVSVLPPPPFWAPRFRAVDAITSSYKMFFRTVGYINKAHYKSIFCWLL